MNSRLDTIQAAVLLAKFPSFRNFELEAINDAAAMYAERLGDIEGLVLPKLAEGMYSSWAQYTVQLPEGTDRKVVQDKLKADGIPTNIYYIRPMHRQGAFTGTRSAEADCPVTEELCSRVLCLPIHPYLKEEEIEFIAGRLKDCLKG